MLTGGDPLGADEPSTEPDTLTAYIDGELVEAIRVTVTGRVIRIEATAFSAMTSVLARVSQQGTARVKLVWSMSGASFEDDATCEDFEVFSEQSTAMRESGVVATLRTAHIVGWVQENN